MYRARMSAAKAVFATLMRRKPTESEKLLRRALNKASKPTQYRWQFQSMMRGYILDFYCPVVRIAVEVDGSAHDGREKKDETRDAVLRKQVGIVTVRFTNEEVLADPDKIAGSILALCDRSPRYKTWNEGRRKAA